MGRVAQTILDSPKVYCCRSCNAHLARGDDISSKDFHGRHGPAYLFKTAVNVSVGPSEDRVLMTGLHVVRDMFCNVCHHELGWKYDEAYEESQKYKEGKVVIEKAMMVRCW
mmetsp:Transcript_582/g.1111  ORF Transcript_582/g.1111 Transcript_582/m.1111 type:complete len:111 (-) Transcript_582:91-423(-)